MLFPEHFLAVRVTIGPGHEEEFNRWYAVQHIPDGVGMFPGCVSASRHRVKEEDRSQQYMALYTFDSDAHLKAAIASNEIEELIRWFNEALRSFSTSAIGVVVGGREVLLKNVFYMN